MRGSDLMTVSADSVRVTDTIAHAAHCMAEVGVGALPILSDGKLAHVTIMSRDGSSPPVL